MTPLCFDGAGALGWARLAGDVARLRPQIAAASHICNLAADRYDFTVGLAAALLNGQDVVLPAADSPEAIAVALSGAAEPLLFRKRPVGDGAEEGVEGDAAALRAALAQSRAAVEVFTSGTTGAPRRQRKSWTMLAAGAGVADEMLRELGLTPRNAAILGATPHQHMFGLEVALFTGLALGWPLHRGRVFYPADLAEAVAQARRCGLTQLALTVSPTHLRHLTPALLAAPEIRAVISATAPLPQALAAQLERRGDLAVLEIYGSSETGSIASRRSAREALWTPRLGFALTPAPQGAMATAPHLPAPTPLSDLVEIEADGRFRLLGRSSDIISVGGKRASLTALSEALLDVEGVLDGIALHESSARRDWIGAVVVADPARLPDAAAVKAAIRKRFLRRFDPVLAPRRVFLVERLPRNALGKIPAPQVEQMRGRLRREGV